MRTLEHDNHDDSNDNVVIDVAMKVQCTKIECLYDFRIRNRNYGLGHILRIGLLGPLGSVVNTTFPGVLLRNLS